MIIIYKYCMFRKQILKTIDTSYFEAFICNTGISTIEKILGLLSLYLYSMIWNVFHGFVRITVDN